MLQPPFLKRISLNPARIDRKTYPFPQLRYLTDDFEFRFDNAITIIVGENGSGKSTLIEAMAQASGFGALGGSAWHRVGVAEGDNALIEGLRLSWLPQVKTGFFFRAESFFNVASYLDGHGPGGKLHERSHGEAFLDTFLDRLDGESRAIYFLDEPEVALSPQRQLAFLRIMRQWQLSGQVQAVIATHSPMLMSLPGAALWALDSDGLRPTTLEQTEHYRITRAFLGNPAAYFASLFSDLE